MTVTREGNAIIGDLSDMPELISMSYPRAGHPQGSVRCELTGEEINEQRIIKALCKLICSWQSDGTR